LPLAPAFSYVPPSDFSSDGGNLSENGGQNNGAKMISLGDDYDQLSSWK